MCVLEEFTGSGVNSLHFVANGNEMTCHLPGQHTHDTDIEEGICDRNYKNDHFLIHHVTQYSLGRYTLGLVLYLIFAKCHIYLMFWFCKSLCVVLHNVIKDNIFWTLLLVVFLHVVVADNRFIKLFYQTRPLSAPFLFSTSDPHSQAGSITELTNKKMKVI